jgi:hypothetical protein
MWEGTASRVMAEDGPYVELFIFKILVRNILDSSTYRYVTG